MVKKKYAKQIFAKTIFWSKKHYVKFFLSKFFCLILSKKILVINFVERNGGWDSGPKIVKERLSKKVHSKKSIGSKIVGTKKFSPFRLF